MDRRSEHELKAVFRQRFLRCASDLLTKETCTQMTQRGPKAKVVEIPGVGHAPTLMHQDQIRIVRDFLLQ